MSFVFRDIKENCKTSDYHPFGSFVWIESSGVFKISFPFYGVLRFIVCLSPETGSHRVVLAGIELRDPPASKSYFLTDNIRA